MGQFVPKLIAPESWDQMVAQNVYMIKMSMDEPVRFRFGIGIGVYIEISRASQGYVVNMLDFETGEPTLLGKLDDDSAAIIGRTSDCHIKLAQPVMSRQHLELKVWGKKLIVAKDLGSTNGTFMWKEVPIVNLTGHSAEIESPAELEKRFGIDITPLLNEYSEHKGS
jgi:hypothetical protein